MTRSAGPASAGLRVAAISMLLLGQMAGGQSVAVPASDLVAAAVAAPLPPQQWRLERGTAVQLMILTEVNSRDFKPGDRFKLRVDRPVAVDGRTLIPEGATAWGEVASADPSGRIGQAGSLAARLLHIDLDGTPIRLSGQSQATGGEGTDRLLLSVIGFGVLGLLTKGHNAKLKAGDLLGATLSDSLLFVPGQPPVVVDAVAISPALPMIVTPDTAKTPGTDRPQ